MDKNLSITQSIAAYESNARTYANNFPVAFVKGENDTVWDMNGKKYVDLLGGAGTLALGHNPDVVVNAMRDFLNSGQIMHGLDLSTPIKEHFIETLYSCLPENIKDLYKIQFCGPTGSDAVDAAMKLFKTYTNRENIIAFHGSYHGVGQSTLALTGDLGMRKNVRSLMPNVHFLPFPYYYRNNYNIDKDDYVSVLLNYIEGVFSDSNSGINKPAAMIMEVVQGEGGCIPAPLEFVKGIGRIAKEHDIPLIIDEIQTGFLRTGSMFAFEESGIVPDAIVVSKAVGGGLPLSAVLYKKKYDTWSSGSHAGTFRGNQLGMVAGIATLDYLKKSNLADEVKIKGEYIKTQLQSFGNQIPIIGEVRGKGLMIGLEINEKNIYNPANIFTADVMRAIRKLCFQKGVIIEAGGRNLSVIRMLPPLTITMDNIVFSLNVIKEVLKEISLQVERGEIL